jgi:hypothetical protein
VITKLTNIWDAPSMSQPGIIMLVIGMLGALLIFLTKSRSRIKADKGLSR